MTQRKAAYKILLEKEKLLVLAYYPFVSIVSTHNNIFMVYLFTAQSQPLMTLTKMAVENIVQKGENAG